MQRTTTLGEHMLKLTYIVFALSFATPLIALGNDDVFPDCPAENCNPKGERRKSNPVRQDKPADTSGQSAKTCSMTSISNASPIYGTLALLGLCARRRRRP